MILGYEANIGLIFYGPKWSWAEMVMGRNGHGPKWLWAEMTRNRVFIYLYPVTCNCWSELGGEEGRWGIESLKHTSNNRNTLSFCTCICL